MKSVADAAPRTKRARNPRKAEFIAPQLATAVAEAPASGNWYSELKLDGYRMLAHLDGDVVTCYSRNGVDWTRRVPGIADDLRALSLTDTWLDGELVAIDPGGRATFQLLQQTLDSGDDSSLLYCVFDVLRADGRDLRELTLAERKVELARTLGNLESSRHVRLLEHAPGVSKSTLDRICDERLEGLILKDVNSPYTSGRTRTWLKLKCRRQQEFVVGGYTRTRSGRDTLTSLLLGHYETGGKLTFAGRVGTGFSEETLRTLRGRLDRLTRSQSAFDPPPPARTGEQRVWTTPRIVAQVQFAGWTDQGLLRQPMFVGLRADRPPRSIKRVAEPVAHRPSTGKRKSVRGTKKNDESPAARPSVTPPGITHPERVLFPEGAVTKGELAAYYAAIAESLWPHVARRPLSLLRKTENGQAFFQRHPLTRGSMPGLQPVDNDGDAPYLAATSREAIQTFGQFSCVEIHTWGSLDRDLQNADRITFDLDPDPALAWEKVRDAAQLVRELLERFELKSFVKTTGGKGLHIVIPLATPRPAWKEAAEFSRRVAQHFARTFPALFSARAGARNRQQKIFIDHLRNRDAATTVAAYSPRLRPGAPVSMPLGWNELADKDVRDAHFNLRNAVAHVSTRGRDPWAEYSEVRQRILRKHLARLAELT